jgi:hypothetical protein
MKSVFAGILFAVATISSAHATVISTMNAASQAFTCLGTDSSCGQTFGQTFRVSTTDTFLTDFTFSLSPVYSNLKVIFELFAWNGADKTGTSLFDSAITTLSNSNSSQNVTFSPNVNLIQGQSYIAFLNSAGISGNNSNKSSGFNVVADSAYSSGTFLWERTAGNGSWNEYGYDAKFAATLVAPVPAAAVSEPGIVALLGLGLLGVAASRRKAAKK